MKPWCVTHAVTLIPSHAELVGYSLAQQANPGAISPDYLMFYIHDIVLDYLKDTMPKKKQVSRLPSVKCSLIPMSGSPLLHKNGV